MLFLFFSILGEWGGWVLKSMENSILFYFLFLKASLSTYSLQIFYGSLWLPHLKHNIKCSHYNHHTRKDWNAELFDDEDDANDKRKNCKVEVEEE